MTNFSIAETPGLGVQLMSFIILCVILIRNMGTKDKSGRESIVNLLIISGLVRAVSFALLNCGTAYYGNMGAGSLAEFCGGFGANFLFFAGNLSESFIMCFTVAYVYKKAGVRSGIGRLLMMLVNVIIIFFLVSFIVNFFKPIIIKLGPDGSFRYHRYDPDGNDLGGYKLYYLFLLSNCIVLVSSFLFTFIERKNLIKNEISILVSFSFLALLPTLSTLIYSGRELEPRFIITTVLCILIVFYDHVEVEKALESGKAAIVRLNGEKELDPLTGLYNSEAFKGRVSGRIRADGSGKSCLAVIEPAFITELNETYGRGFGDDVIKKMAESISSTARYDDITGRIGTNQLAVFFSCEESYFGELSARLHSALEVEVDGVKVGAYLGAARTGENGADYNYIVDAADKALKTAKTSPEPSYRLINK